MTVKRGRDLVPNLSSRSDSEARHSGSDARYLLVANLANTAFGFSTLLLVTRWFSSEEQRQVLLFLSLQGIAILTLVSPWELIGARLFLTRNARVSRDDSVARTQRIVSLFVALIPALVISFWTEADPKRAIGFASVGATAVIGYFLRARLVAGREYIALATASLAQTLPIGLALFSANRTEASIGWFFFAHIIGNTLFITVSANWRKSKLSNAAVLGAHSLSFNCTERRQNVKMLVGLGCVTAAQTGMVQLPLWIGDLRSQEAYSLATIALATSTASAVTGFCMAPTLATLVQYLQLSSDELGGNFRSLVVHFLRLAVVSTLASTAFAQVGVFIVLGEAPSQANMLLCTSISLSVALGSMLSVLKGRFLRFGLDLRLVCLAFLPVVLGLGVGLWVGPLMALGAVNFVGAGSLLFTLRRFGVKGRLLAL